MKRSEDFFKQNKWQWMTKVNSNLKLKEKENNLSKRVIRNRIAIKFVLKMFRVDSDDLTCLLYIHWNYIHIHIQFIFNLYSILYDIIFRIKFLFCLEIKLFFMKKINLNQKNIFFSLLNAFFLINSVQIWRRWLIVRTWWGNYSAEKSPRHTSKYQR